MKKSAEFKKQLSETYKYRIELHAHTSPVSRCSQIEPEKMAKIYSEKNYDGIVITNHFTNDEVELFELNKEDYIKRYINDYEETKLHGEKHGLKVYLGAEIRFTENSNDYLLYGVDTDILSKCFDYLKKGIEKFRKEVKLADTLFVQAHPFRNNMTQIDPALLDGMEIFNMHPGHNSRIGICTRYAFDNNIPVMTVGSDFHHPDIGHEAVSALRTKTLPADSFELAKILKSGDYLFEIGEHSIVIP